jgi:hypothetical protein
VEVELSRTYLTLEITLILGIIAIFVFPYYSITPGVLIEGHQCLKHDCFDCHTLSRGAITEKCIRCHSLSSIGKRTVAGIPIVKENKKSSLIHQSIPNIECFYCHTEHQGRSKETATIKFTHTVLSGSVQNDCEQCHNKPNTIIHTVQTIQTIDCSECHAVDRWSITALNHTLLGDEINNCTVCHVKNIPGDELHTVSKSKDQCGTCHTTSAWKPSTYDHTKYFRFDNNHPSRCADCHTVSAGFSLYTCYNCHEHTLARIAEKHQKEGIPNFENCVKCHRSGNEDEIIGKEKIKKRKSQDNEHEEKD